VISEFPQHVLPLSSNVCISVMSERHHGDSHSYRTLRYCCRITFEYVDKNW